MATPDEKYELITRRLQEFLGGDTIKKILDEGRQPKCYWGMCMAHFHYFRHLSFLHRHCAHWKAYVS